MPQRKKPNWQYPCAVCGNCVKEGPKSICCDKCNLWVHFKCANISLSRFKYLSLTENRDVPFYCAKCRPIINSSPQHSSNNDSTSEVHPNPSQQHSSINPTLINTTNITSKKPTLEADAETNLLNSSTSDFSSCHSSDFEFESDSDDLESRGLNFNAVPSCSKNNHIPKQKAYSTITKSNLSIKTRKYKYPCIVCSSPCLENRQNSICCTICDNWVHQKCTDLTLEQFNTYCDEDNNDPYYCTNCLFGRSSADDFEQPDSTSHKVISTLLNRDDVPNFCPNSVFNDTEDLTLSEYFTCEELNNLQLLKTEDDILLLHVNADSLILNHEKIVNTLSMLSIKPSIIFISETRLHDSKLEWQLPQISIDGYDLFYNNSSTKAGGVAMYVSNKLKFIERTDIKFNFDNCEACFIEVLCANENDNHIFGTLYRHPIDYARSFTNYLGEFLETFTERKTKLTLLGDINIDLNKSNIVSTEYVNTISSAGFTTMVNQPTRIYHYENTNSVSCSTIDHMITNSSSNFSKVGILISDIADHLPVFGCMTLAKPCIKKNQKLFKRHFTENKKDAFLKCLEDKLKG